jgi:hypothetical protein
MTMAKRFMLIMALLVTTALVTKAAGAYTWNSASGNSCVRSEDGVIAYGHNGAVNLDTHNDSIFMCPLGLGTQGSNPRFHEAVAIRYVDGSSTVDFSCKVCQTIVGGATYCSFPKYTCSPTQAGGCDDETMAYTGNGVLEFNQTNMGANVYRQWVDTAYNVMCAVPPMGTGFSSVVAYWSGEP